WRSFFERFIDSPSDISTWYYYQYINTRKRMQGLSKSTRLKGASKKPVLQLRLRTQHPAPAVTRRKFNAPAVTRRKNSFCGKT
ncbi:MAG TPA: hypothetical protein VLQ66_10445, partial [Paenisporosarcina sp.]|nr:hypothetical protein [Paenisporosarcina sp.]